MSVNGPIDICITNSTKLFTSPLNWNNYDTLPKKLQLTNTGRTVIITGKWNSERPYISGGFLNDQYIFYQLHFHWKNDSMDFSGHTVDGMQYQIEMHVVHFNRKYFTPEEAEKYHDGILIITYFFKIRSWDNTNFNELFNCLNDIKHSNTSTKICDVPLSQLFHKFTDDYFMYHGNISSTLVMYFFCRRPIFISDKQFKELVNLNDCNGNNIEQKLKPIKQNMDGKYVYFINPSPLQISTLYYIFD